MYCEDAPTLLAILTDAKGEVIAQCQRSCIFTNSAIAVCPTNIAIATCIHSSRYIAEATQKTKLIKLQKVDFYSTLVMKNIF